MKVGKYTISKKQILIVISIISVIFIFGYLFYQANNTGPTPTPIICKEDEELVLCKDGNNKCIKKCNADQDRCPEDDECNSVCLDNTQKCINGVPCDKKNICSKNPEICCDSPDSFCNTNGQCTQCDSSTSKKCESSDTCCLKAEICCGAKCCGDNQKCVNGNTCCGKDQEFIDNKCCNLNQIYEDEDGELKCCDTGSVCYNNGKSTCCTSTDSKCTIKSTCVNKKCEYTDPEDGTTKYQSIPGGCNSDDDCLGLGYKIGNCYKASMDDNKIQYEKVGCDEPDKYDIVHDGGCSIVCKTSKASNLPAIYCPDGTTCSSIENSGGISTRYCTDNTDIPKIKNMSSNPEPISVGTGIPEITACSQYYEVDSKYKDNDCLLYNTNIKLPPSGQTVNPSENGIKPVHDSSVDKYFCPVSYTDKDGQSYFISPLGLSNSTKDVGVAPIQVTTDSYQGYGTGKDPSRIQKTGKGNVKNVNNVNFPFGPYLYGKDTNGVTSPPVLRSQKYVTYDGKGPKPRLIDCISELNENGLTKVDLNETQDDPVCTGTFDCSKYLDTNSSVANKIKSSIGKVKNLDKKWSGLYCRNNLSPRYGTIEDQNNNNTLSGVVWCEKSSYIGIA